MRSLIEFRSVANAGGQTTSGQATPTISGMSMTPKSSTYGARRDASTSVLRLFRLLGQGHPRPTPGDTVAQVLKVTHRFADKISDHPAHARIAMPLANADTRMATLPQPQTFA
jgi:hypothetical protein